MSFIGKLQIALALQLLLILNIGNAQIINQWKVAKDTKGYTYKYVSGDPMNARFYTLKNGLSIILSVNKKDPRIQTYITVRAGSKNDPSDHTGLAHYLEHMLFKGTKKYGTLDWNKEQVYINQIEQLYNQYNKKTNPLDRKALYKKIDSVSGIAAKYAIPNEYDKLMASIGAQGTNAFTSVEQTVYQEDIPSSSVNKFIAIQGERFSYPVFRLFHTELEAVYEEKNRGLDNDNNKVFEALLSGLFPTHNYGQQTTIGTIEHLKNPSLTAIRNFYNQWYVPNNMAVIMAGDFDPAEVVQKIEQHFSYMQAKPLKMYNPAPEKDFEKPITKEVFGPNAESVMIGFRLPGANNFEAQTCINLINSLLSNGKAGLIDIGLNQNQKVLKAGAFTEAFADYSIFGLSGNPRPGQNLEEVKELLLNQLDIIKQGNFDPLLLKAIVNNAKLDETKALENNQSRASALMNSFTIHRGEKWLQEVQFTEQLSKISKETIVDFAKQYFKNNYVIVYKRKGEDKNLIKVEKPQITPVAINRTKQSPFYKQINSLPSSTIKPEFIDFEKAISFGKVGPAQVLYTQNKESRLFRLHYRFELGSYHNKLLPWAASYLNYLGTNKQSAADINKAFYAIACDFNISPGSEETTVTITGLQENFKEAVSLFEDLLNNCVANDAAFENFKASIFKIRENNKTNKSAIMKGMVQYAIYGKNNPFNYQLSNDELKALNAKDLVDVLHSLKNYTHKIIYYGPLALSSLEQEISGLHTIPGSFISPIKAVNFTKTNQNSNLVYFTNYNMVQAEINWIRNNDVYDSGKSAQIRLFNNYFGGGMGSIVFQTIRESKALAYSTYAQYSSPDKKDERYTTAAYVGTQADKMTEAIAGMNELLNELPVSDINFNNAMASIKQDIETQRITQDGIIFSYLTASKYGLSGDNRKQVYEKLHQLTLKDMVSFHDTYLKNKPYTYCILASADKVSMDQLKKYGTVETLSLEQIFGY